MTFVSIIIPCFNDSSFIGEAITSAASQYFNQKEVIVIDDGSNEETKTEIAKYSNSIDLLITQENNGPSAARNKGIQAAKGEFILVLDSDDFFEPTFCEKAVGILERDQDIKMVTSFARWFKDSRDFQIFKPIGGGLSNFLFQNASLGTMFRKKDWEEIGGYDEKMKLGFEDWEFYLRIHKGGGKTFVIPEILFHYRNKKRSRNETANRSKFDLQKYIFNKHADLYKEYFESFTSFLLNSIKNEEAQKLKRENSLNFTVGRKILQPLRFLKKRFQKK